MNELTPKQERFCREYLVDFNATQAAIRAGYSEKTARSQGSRLLTNADVQAFLSELQNEQQARLEVAADQVISELASVAFASMKDIIGGIGKGGVTYKKISEIPDHVLAAISSITHTANGLNIRFHDKVGALDKLMKHFGLYEDETLVLSVQDKEILAQHYKYEQMTVEELRAERERLERIASRGKHNSDG